MRSHRVTVLCALWSTMVAHLLLYGCGPTTPYVPPPFTAEESEWEIYHQAQIEGRLDEAATGFEHMCLAEKSYARACYDHSRVLAEAGRHEEAIASATRFIEEHPRHGLAPSAATRIARSFDDLERAEEAIPALEQLASKVKGKDVWDSVVFEVAQIHRLAGRGDDELLALDRIRKKGRWGSQLWDNAIWRMIAIREEQGDTAAEKALLKELVDTMEESHLIASYNSPYHGKALLRLGVVYFQEDRLDKARSVFMELVAWKSSRLRDDGYFWVAKVDLKRGKRSRACRSLRKIIDMKDASTGRKAREMFAREGCDKN